MQVAVPWSTNIQFRYGDEYNIGFDNNKNNFDNLFDFLLKYPDIRFNIIPFEMPFEYILAADNIHDNIYFRIDAPELEMINSLRDKGIKYYFGPEYAASSFTSLDEQIQLGVTDVYIYDDLCYNLAKVKRACAIHGVRTRLILNDIPSKRYDRYNNPKAPIFIPECVDELSNYIDVGEIDSSSWAKIGTYYRIWFERKEWRENLKYIYPQLQLNIPNQSLIPNFSDFKMNCAYRCACGSSCKKCQQFIEIAQELENKIEYVKIRE